MRILRDAWGRDDLPFGTVGTVGNYDGLHRGQQAVLARVAERARETGLVSAAVTFEPHPRTVLRPEEPVAMLTTRRQKEKLLAASGLDVLVSVRFTTEFARTSAEEFVDRLIVEGLGMRQIFVGSEFTFGRDREGDLPMLRRLGESRGFEAFGVEEVLHDGRPVSSTRIRQALAQGRVEEAAAMLGRPYALGGIIVHGDSRGRELGWPTANLEPDNELFPADGVYAAVLRTEEPARALPGVANVGRRPTLGAGGLRVAEIHALDFDGDLYGLPVEILFCRRLRGERRFESLEALRRQIGRDARAAREYFRGGSCLE